MIKLVENDYSYKLRNKFGNRFEVDIIENGINKATDGAFEIHRSAGDPSESATTFTSVIVGVDLGNDYFPNEVFCVQEINGGATEKLLNTLYKQKCINLWVRMQKENLNKDDILNYKS